MEHLPRVLGGNLVECAQRDGNVDVCFHRIDVVGRILLTVSKYALAWNDQSDHSVASLVNRGGLPSSHASTSIFNT